MKVKCIKTSINNPNNRIINSNMEDYMLIGSLFLVYGIQFTKNVTYLYIFNDSHLIEVPIEMFDIIDNSISNNWKVKIWDDGSITLWPELFYQDDFIENFSEHEKKERSLFKELRILMENEM